MKTAKSFVSAGILSFLVGVSGVHAQGAANNTNSKVAPATSYQDWLSQQSQVNHGYISRRAYMDEMGRRWDAMDSEHRGLTREQIDSMYAAPSPGEVKANSSYTNPTGTEPRGQNSGGK
jgi:hypothetical protein